MMEWISANIATMIMAVILLLIVFLIIRSKMKERKQGGCGCGCPGCTGSCAHTIPDKNKTEGKNK